MRWTTTDRTPAAGGFRTGRASRPPTGSPSGAPDGPSTEQDPAVAATARCLVDLDATGTVQEIPAGLRTAADIAEHLGVPPAAVAVTTVLGTPGGGRLLVVASGTHRLFPPLLAAVLGLPELEVLDAAEVLRCTGSAPGSASPVGLRNPLTTVVDVTLAPHPAIWVPAGHPQAVFRSRYDELLRLTGGQPVELG